MSSDLANLNGLQYSVRLTHTKVRAAPARIMVPLVAIMTARERGWYAADDMLYVGTDRAGNEVSYRVVGWDAESNRLILDLESD